MMQLDKILSLVVILCLVILHMMNFSLQLDIPLVILLAIGAALLTFTQHSFYYLLVVYVADAVANIAFMILLVLPSTRDAACNSLKQTVPANLDPVPMCTQMYGVFNYFAGIHAAIAVLCFLGILFVIRHRNAVRSEQELIEQEKAEVKSLLEA
ncbi:hypothetical protein EDD86DRAFT_200684, partial [Gorgonomyces haynaldii]